MIIRFENAIRRMAMGIALILAQAVGVEAQQTKRPNIIFLLTDDHRWDALGVMGNKIIRTPPCESGMKR